MLSRFLRRDVCSLTHIGSPARRHVHQVALVVGGTRGIGAEVAASLAKQNYAVAIAGRDLAQSTNVAMQIGQNCKGFQCDIANSASVDELVRAVERDPQLGPLDVVINSAGVNVDSLLVRAQDHDIQQMIGTNIAGALYLSRAACKTMMRRRRGVIINIGSIAATQSNAGQVVYATTKAALVGLTKGLAKEMAPKGIRVNLVSPGFVATDMTKHLVQDPPAKQQTDNDRVSIRRVGSVEEVAQVINKVITHETLTGEELFVDGSGELIL